MKMAHQSRTIRFVAMVSVLNTFAFGVATAQTTITGNTSNPGGHDTWNVSANWDFGIPSGTDSAIIGTGVYAEAWNDSTPTYSGTLTMQDNSTLQMGWTTHRPNSLNALGTGGVTMGDNTEIRLRMPQTVDLPNLTLNGAATIDLSPSTSAHHRTRNFNNVIDGPGSLTLVGNNNNTASFGVANPDWSGGLTADAVDSWRVDADTSGAFGTGDVTINERTAGDRGGTLRVNAPDVMDDFATLFVNGSKDHRLASKLILNADDTIGAFFLDGIDQGIGMFDASSGLLDDDGDPLITGSGVLTVTGITSPGSNAVPEPASILMWSIFALCLGGFGCYRRWQKR